MSVKPGEVLYVDIGDSAVCWYRCALPATFGGHDWVGMLGTPPKVRYVTGLVKGQTIMPAIDSYRVVVLQQPRGAGWLKVIRGLQSRGVRVVFEVDDYVHAIRRMQDHDFRSEFTKDKLRELELNMRVCDAVICSTAFIARRYRSFNPRTFVCENGIDVGRYQLTRPERPAVNVGWAGATGHGRAVAAWLDQLAG